MQPEYWRSGASCWCSEILKTFSPVDVCCLQSYDDKEDLGLSYNGHNQDLEPHGPFGDMGMERRSLCHALLCCNSCSNSNGWFFWRWVSLIRVKMRCVRYSRCIPFLCCMGRRGNFCRCLIRILPGVERGNIESFPCYGMFVRDDRDVALITHIYNRMESYVATTIVKMHPICDSIGCSSGMKLKRDATRILRSQRGFHGQGSPLEGTTQS